jgi:hypothetical protein
MDDLREVLDQFSSYYERWANCKNISQTNFLVSLNEGLGFNEVRPYGMVLFEFVVPITNGVSL